MHIPTTLSLAGVAFGAVISGRTSIAATNADVTDTAVLDPGVSTGPVGFPVAVPVPSTGAPGLSTGAIGTYISTDVTDTAMLDPDVSTGPVGIPVAVPVPSTGAPGLSTGAIGTYISTTCPVGTVYNGWYNSAQRVPPLCKKVRPTYKPVRKPKCRSNEKPYCSINPVTYVEYSRTHDYCRDTGFARGDCFPATADDRWIQGYLGQDYCPPEKATTQLGPSCLTNKAACRNNWWDLPLRTNPNDLTGLLNGVGSLLASLGTPPGGNGGVVPPGGVVGGPCGTGGIITASVGGLICVTVGAPPSGNGGAAPPAAGSPCGNGGILSNGIGGLICVVTGIVNGATGSALGGSGGPVGPVIGGLLGTLTGGILRH